jgi:hypothetical protein
MAAGEWSLYIWIEGGLPGGSNTTTIHITNTHLTQNNTTNKQTSKTKETKQPTKLHEQ